MTACDSDQSSLRFAELKRLRSCGLIDKIL